MKKIISFLCIIVSLFFMGCKKDMDSKKLDIEEPKIMNSENKEIVIDSENNEESGNKYTIVYDNGPQKSPLIKALIEHGYKLTREEFFEIFGHYPGEYPCGEPIKYDLLEGKDNLKK